MTRGFLCNTEKDFRVSEKVTRTCSLQEEGWGLNWERLLTYWYW